MINSRVTYSFSLMISTLFIVLLFIAVVYHLVKLFRQRTNTDTEATITNEKPSYRDESSTALPALPASVTAWDNGTIGRDQWVLRMTRHVFNERHDARYNVLVINDDLQYHFAADTIIEDLRVIYKDSHLTVPYRIVVFSEGKLVNLGHGGDINWDWMGNFVRHSNSQLTFSPCRRGTLYQQDAWIPTVPRPKEG